MKIRMRYFAALREIAGQAEEILTVPQALQISDLRATLIERYPQFNPLLERAVCAVNHHYSAPDAVLHDDDEVAFIPPTGGGAFVQPVIQLTRLPLERAALVDAVSQTTSGAVVLFEGVVRETSKGKQIRHLVYEVYEEMALAQLRTIAQTAQERWGVEGIAIAHRFGRLEIGETSVIIVVVSPHRAEAFEACRYLIDTLKTTVPIWKKEIAVDGAEWIEG